MGDTLLTHEEFWNVYEIVRKLIDENPNLRGIFANHGGGSASCVQCVSCLAVVVGFKSRTRDRANRRYVRFKLFRTICVNDVPAMRSRSGGLSFATLLASVRAASSRMY